MLNIKDLKPGDKIKYTDKFNGASRHDGSYKGISLGTVLTVVCVYGSNVRFKEISGSHHSVERCFTKDKFEQRKKRLLEACK